MDADANDQGGRAGAGGQAPELPKSDRRQHRAKAIAHPADSKLLERARQHLVKLAAETGLALRQNYNREARGWPRRRMRANLTNHRSQRSLYRSQRPASSSIARIKPARNFTIMPPTIRTITAPTADLDEHASLPCHDCGKHCQILK